MTGISTFPLTLPMPAGYGHLRIALLLSLCAHAAALAIHFSPSRPAARHLRSLEVTLVNARSDTAPIKPKLLAQEQINGGGDRETGHASSPLPRTTDVSAEQAVLAALRKRQEELEAEQKYLYTQLESTQKALSANRLPGLSDSPADAGTDAQHQESLILNAQISAIKNRIDHYNALPRQQFMAPSTAVADYAQYVEAWRKKIELLGTEHYPDEARGKIYGTLQLTVYIKKNGELARIDIDRPSEHAVLNLAARRIVQLAAPFAPLPPAIAKDTDILAITRSWHFVNNRLDTDTP